MVSAVDCPGTKRCMILGFVVEGGLRSVIQKNHDSGERLMSKLAA